MRTAMTAPDLILLVVTLALAAAVGAHQFRTPAPVVLAVVGLVAGLAWMTLPGLPPVRVSGDGVLLAFLPPLLFSAAYALPLAAFRRNLGPILLLAIGLVLATIAVTAVTARFTTGIPWAAALLLGAIVAPPDPVAATAVAGRTGLANRFVVILEGEGLVNDAVAIVAYGLALDAAQTGSFTWSHTLLSLATEPPGGVAVGLAFAWLIVRIRGRMDNVLVEGALLLLAPYLAYRVADRLGVSGVLAVVTLGFVMRRVEVRISSPAARLASRTVLAAVQFATTGLVFLLVGLLVGELLAFGVTRHLAASGAMVASAVIAVRLTWMYVVPRIYHLTGGAPPTWGELTVLGWAGMRGVVTLALALAVPAIVGTAASGTDARAVILAHTLAVIVATLVVQGVTLMPLIRALRVGDPTRAARDEARARSHARRAGLAALERVMRETPALRDDCEDLARHVREGGVGIAAPGFAHLRRAPGDPLRHVLQAQREVVERLRDAGRLAAATADDLITELDVDAMSARGDSARLTRLRG